MPHEPQQTTPRQKREVAAETARDRQDGRREAKERNFNARGHEAYIRSGGELGWPPDVWRAIDEGENQ